MHPGSIFLAEAVPETPPLLKQNTIIAGRNNSQHRIWDPRCNSMIGSNPFQLVLKLQSGARMNKVKHDVGYLLWSPVHTLISMLVFWDNKKAKQASAYPFSLAKVNKRLQLSVVDKSIGYFPKKLCPGTQKWWCFRLAMVWIGEMITARKNSSNVFMSLWVSFEDRLETMRTFPLSAAPAEGVEKTAASSESLLCSCLLLSQWIRLREHLHV